MEGANVEILSNSFGVAQGSSLGPLLFVLFINDLINSVKCLPRLFANDTCLVVLNRDIMLLEQEMNQELSNVYKWCNTNQLSLNPAKSS